MAGDTFTRRDFLRVAAGAAAVAAAGGACGSGSSKPKASAAKGGQDKRTLRIAQWTNYISGYDQWWDEEYTRRWGEKNGVSVVIDHFDINQGPPQAEAEASKQGGHDIFQLTFGSAPSFEDEVIDHREIIEEVEAKVGKMTAHVERSVFNPKTGKYFGFPDFWIPNMVHYRSDLWDPVGLRPDTWEDVLTAGTGLASKVQLLPIPGGPEGRMGPYVVSVCMIWKFARNAELAKQFLVDLAIDYREPFIRSTYNQFPSFPGSVGDFGELLASDGRAQPPGKYRFLAEAPQWTANIGHPGYSNAAADEIMKASLISRMFAPAARGEMSAEDAVKAAEAQMKPIFEKWRERGKI